MAQAVLGDREAFARDLERAFRIRPNSGVALALAKHFEEQGLNSRASRWRAAALRLDPQLDSR